VTTIAWDGSELCADSRASSGSRSVSVTKIARLKDGSLFGFAGTAAAMLKVRRWFDAGADPDAKPKFRGDIDVLVIRPDGVAVEYERTLDPLVLKDRVAAIGSGGEYAIGAMEWGATAYQAVEAACRRDPYSAPPIDRLTLKP
jgi:ATP-dependent protease HslVU (ClpYQ) peptidase subunit